MTPTRCDVLIIGSGPAGLFAADQLHQAGVAGVMIVERGQPMSGRRVSPRASL